MKQTKCSKTSCVCSGQRSCVWLVSPANGNRLFLKWGKRKVKKMKTSWVHFGLQTTYMFFFHTFCIKGCLNVSPIPDWPVWQLFIDGTKAYKTNIIINSTYCTLNFDFFFSPFQCTNPPSSPPLTHHACLNGEHERGRECREAADTSRGFGWNICTASQSANVHVCWDVHSELSHIYMPASQLRVCVTFSWLAHVKPQAAEQPGNSRAATLLYVSTGGDIDRLSTCLTFHTFLCYSWARVWSWFVFFFLLRWR